MIDVFSHFLPPAVLARFLDLKPGLPALSAFGRLPELWDIDARLRSLEPFPEVRQILNFGNPPVETFGTPAVAAELARLANEEMAKLCAKYPHRFPGFTAVLPMSDVELALAELEYAHRELGARGIQIYTNVLGSPVSGPRYRPLFQEMAHRDLPVLVHPFRTAATADYPTESDSPDEVWFTFGWPYETSAFAARMVYSGIFGDFPDIKIVLHHFGGMIPSFGARIELGFQQIFTGPDGPNPVAVQAGITTPVIEHYRRFYADTALNGSKSAVRAGYDFFGPDRSVFGTDAPFCQDGGPTFVAKTLEAIKVLDLPESDRLQVLEGNARRLFRLADPDDRGSTTQNSGA